MRQGEAEAIQDYINREDIRALPWLLAYPHVSLTRARDRRYPNRYRRDNRFETERGSSLTVVNRKTESVMRQAVLVITFTPL